MRFLTVLTASLLIASNVLAADEGQQDISCTEEEAGEVLETFMMSVFSGDEVAIEKLEMIESDMDVAIEKVEAGDPEGANEVCRLLQ